MKQSNFIIVNHIESDNLGTVADSSNETRLHITSTTVNQQINLFSKLRQFSYAYNFSFESNFQSGIQMLKQRKNKKIENIFICLFVNNNKLVPTLLGRSRGQPKKSNTFSEYPKTSSSSNFYTGHRPYVLKVQRYSKYARRKPNIKGGYDKFMQLTSVKYSKTWNWMLKCLNNSL